MTDYCKRLASKTKRFTHRAAAQHIISTARRAPRPDRAARLRRAARVGRGSRRAARRGGGVTRAEPAAASQLLGRQVHVWSSACLELSTVYVPRARNYRSTTGLECPQRLLDF